jgi:hypothetical protein
VWAQMGALGPALDDAVVREGIDPLAIEGLERIRAILTFAGKPLAGVEPQLVQQDALDPLSNNFQSAISHVTAYVADGDVAHLPR